MLKFQIESCPHNAISAANSINLTNLISDELNNMTLFNIHIYVVDFTIKYINMLN